jgi:hypothetical protein
MFELKNMAALDGFRAKEDAALQKVFGPNFEQPSKDLATMREIYGTKTRAGNHVEVVGRLRLRGFAPVRSGHHRFHVFFPRRLSASIIDCAVSVW